MRRARETAAPLADTLGLDVVVDDGLEEFDAHLHFYIPLEEMTPDDPRWHQLVAEWTRPEAERPARTFRAAGRRRGRADRAGGIARSAWRSSATAA